jgi:hypothetical protein
VKLFAAAAQQAVIGCVADERVLEEISGVGRRAAGKDEAGLAEAAEGVLKLALSTLGHRRQQLVGKFAADRGGNLGDFPGRRTETIASRHQRRM